MNQPVRSPRQSRAIFAAAALTKRAVAILIALAALAVAAAGTRPGIASPYDAGSRDRNEAKGAASAIGEEVALPSSPAGPEQLREPGQDSYPDRAVDIPLGGSNEPAVVVDPNNPNLVVYASLFRLRISGDGGQSFRSEILPQLPPTHSICGDPSLAIDSQGRLFWTYLGCTGGGYDIFIARVDPIVGNFPPGYPVNVTSSPSVNLPGAGGNGNDKEWLAADFYATSPFRDRLYLIWTDFNNGTTVYATSSGDQGMTWTAPATLSTAGEGFVWPTHITAASTGDVYAAYHVQPTYVDNVPDGVSGQQIVLRSTDGGRTYPQKAVAFPPGTADITFNVQDRPRGVVDGARFWWQGSAQPWVMAHPFIPGTVYVVSNDDPDNDHDSADDANVYIATSMDSGMTWGPPVRVDSGPGNTFQVMPSASIDPTTGDISVLYYDNRNLQRNSSNYYLLDAFVATSANGGLSFSPDQQINDRPFDPDPGAPNRYSGPPPTKRIGEYIGIAAANCKVFAVWCGNTVDGTGTPVGQQTIFDAVDLPSGTVGNVLIALKQGLNVDLVWPADSLAPSRYNMHRTSIKTELDKGNHLAPILNGSGIFAGFYSDVSAVPGPPDIYYYQVYGRACSGASIIQ